MMGLGGDILLDPDIWDAQFIVNSNFIDRECPLYVKKAILEMHDAYLAEDGLIYIKNADYLRELIAKEEKAEGKTQADH